MRVGMKTQVSGMPDLEVTAFIDDSKKKPEELDQIQRELVAYVQVASEILANGINSLPKEMRLQRLTAERVKTIKDVEAVAAENK